MKLLLSAKMEDIDVLKAMLADGGLACEVTNDTIPLPGGEFYPRLWVQDADFPRAAVVLSAFRSAPAPKLGPWTCPNCAEQLESQFMSCWKCGTVRNETAT